MYCKSLFLEDDYYKYQPQLDYVLKNIKASLELRCTLTEGFNVLQMK